MTNQEFFDAAVAHLRKQGRPAETHDFQCVYETEDGLMCAVGGVMPPWVRAAAKAAGVNGNGAGTLRAHCPEADQFFAGVQTGLMEAVQEVHDGNDPDSWEPLFKSVADQFGLAYTPPAQA